MDISQVLQDALRVKNQMDQDYLEWYEPTMPDSWVEDGERHAVIYGGDLIPQSLTLEKVAVGSGYHEWVVKEIVF